MSSGQKRNRSSESAGSFRPSAKKKTPEDKSCEHALLEMVKQHPQTLASDKGIVRAGSSALPPSGASKHPPSDKGAKIQEQQAALRRREMELADKIKEDLAFIADLEKIRSGGSDQERMEAVKNASGKETSHDVQMFVKKLASATKATR